MFNMFIMRSDLLCVYCEWAFPVVLAIEEALDYCRLDAFVARTPGRLFEFLLDTWLATFGVPFLEHPIHDIEPVNWAKKGSAFLAAKFAGRGYKESFYANNTSSHFSDCDFLLTLIRMLGAVLSEMDDNRSARRWFTERSVAEAYEEPERRKPAPKPTYKGMAAEHAARIISLVLSDNVDSIGKAAINDTTSIIMRSKRLSQLSELKLFCLPFQCLTLT